MVNIPLLTMDDYGLLEPTDVGTMTIDYDPKDEFKRRVTRWDQEEVACMLNLIKENNFVNRYSVLKMSSLLSQLMLQKGWNRTDRQIHLKLTTLRKNFLACERQKLINGTLKECPFYKELRDVYRDAHNSNGIDSDEYDTSSQDECLIKFPNDPIDWTKGEVQKMLSIIKSMKLKNELTLTFFSPVAVRMIAEAMQGAGFDRSTEQVKNGLINLRTMYIDYKIGFDNNENPVECMFFPCLDLFWGKEYKKCRLKEKRKIRPDDSWSTEETIVLLTLIQDLNIAEDAYKSNEKAAEELRLSLAENSYCRSMQQIVNRLKQLKSGFINVHTKYAEDEAVQQFPFYNLYKKLFERQFTHDMMNESNLSTSSIQKDSFEYIDLCENSKDATNNSNKAIIWSREEVKCLLSAVQELTSTTHANDSLEEEKLKKLSTILSEAGYCKTAEQIKHKLSLLKQSYIRCNLEDSTERDIYDCPFYNQLHDIFHTPVSDERYEFIQNLLSENLDLNTSKFSDHSYTNINFGNSSSESRTNDKVTVVPNKSIDNWFPVESIIDEGGIAASSTLDFSNLNCVSNNEQEQVVEDALLAALPNNSDTRKEENQVIPEATDSKNQISDKHIPPTSKVILEKETSANKDPNPQFLEDDKDENSDIQVIEVKEKATNSRKTQGSASHVDDDGPTPSKKPRIIEDEKLGKSKFLLRPVDMDPSSLNMTNKFVRLIVANDSNKNRVNHITAHIEPVNINKANSVSSGMSSPIERIDILKLATDKILAKEELDLHKLENENNTNCMRKDFRCIDSNSEAKISETIKEAVQTMMKHNKLMQEKHHAWMEKQFEIQRKRDEEQKKVLMNELKELRSIVTVLLANKLHVNNQNR